MIRKTRWSTVTVAAVAAAAVLLGAGVAPAHGSSYTMTVNGTFVAEDNLSDAALPDFVVGGFSPTDAVVASVALSGHAAGTTLTFPVTDGLSLKFGFASWTSVTSVAFSGPQTAVNAALAAMTISTGAGTGFPTLLVTVALDSGDAALNPQNGHFYRFVPAADITWDQARSAAKASSLQGLSGYLVTITGSGENDFVTSKIEGAVSVWIGASDADTEGRWKWMDGPEAGQVFWEASCVATGDCGGESGTSDYTDSSSITAFESWADGEPNNSYDDVGEDYAVTNWDVDEGEGEGAWNDLAGDYPGVTGYVVEYSGQSSTALRSGRLKLDGSQARISGVRRRSLANVGLSSLTMVLAGAGFLAAGLVVTTGGARRRPRADAC